MIRGYIVYILMFAALGLGLWFVLRVGATLHAPADIAGQWDVQWETASPTGMGYRGVMHVDQSGRYCTLRFDGKRTMSFKIVEGSMLGQGDPRLPIARMQGDGYELRLLPTAVRDAMRMEIVGRSEHRGTAERVEQPAARAAGPSPKAAPVADARH